MRSLISSILGSASEITNDSFAQTDATLREENERMRAELGALRLKLIDLELEADTDPLVPLYNRRAFMRELSRAQTVLERYDIKSSVIYFDLDNFKSVNDKYDHSVGDNVLKMTASVLRRNVRDCDVVARIGGDEFAALLFKSGVDQALTKASEVSREFHDELSALSLSAVNVSISWGVADCLGNMSPEDILTRADAQMLTNKTRLSKSASKDFASVE